MIYDLRRARGLAVILLTSVAITAAYGVILHLALRPLDGWMRQQRADANMTMKGQLIAGFQRVVGLTAPDQAEPLAPGQRLGLLLGPSALWSGIDPYQLRSDFGGPYRWANIVTTPDPDHNLIVTQLIYRRGLRPDALILVVNPCTLVPYRENVEGLGRYDPRLLFHHLARREFELLQEDILNISSLPLRLPFPYHRWQPLHGQVVDVPEVGLGPGFSV
jgi:hypothetical protein